jgi:NMD protein affecting ribosome stability and mRNA decay
MTTRERSKTHPAASQPRVDRYADSGQGDPYRMPGKLPDPSVCPTCKAAYHSGRWTWDPAPVDAERHQCPACRRIADDYPAGIVTLRGSFLAEHGDEIRNLLHNVEAREKQNHPLKRIMAIDAEGEQGLVVKTTDARLARGLGEALHHAYQGELDYDFHQVENVVRVSWSR